MRKTAKLFYTVLCIAVLFVTVFAFSGISADAATSNGYTYTVTDGNATITDVNSTVTGAITIPSSLGGYPVTTIGTKAFEDCTGLTSVVIPNSVTSIEVRAFQNCTNLKTVILSTKLTSIGGYAFYKCGSITEINIPISVKKIDNYAFVYCNGLTKVNTPNLTYWTKIDFGNEQANPLYFAKSLYVDGTLATDITLSSSLTAVKPYTFINCSSITSVRIREGVTSIGTKAFYQCTALTKITTPSTLTSVAADAFTDSTALTEVHISDVNNWCNIVFANEFANPLYYAHNLYINDTLAENIKITTATKVSDYAFIGCTSITNVDVLSNLTSIENHAFDSCSSLVNFNMPDSLTNIGKRAFNGCSSIVKIYIPETVSQLGSFAFYDCTSLRLVMLYPNITEIPYAVFYKCNNIDTVSYFGTSEQWNNITIDTGNGNLTKANILYSDISNGYIYSIVNDNVEIIEYTGLETKITIPNRIDSKPVTKIGIYAFLNCDWITDITFPYYLDEIKYQAINGCTSLKNISFNNKIKTIGYGAFNHCDAIERVDITDIGAWSQINFANTAANPLRYTNNFYLNGELVTDITLPNTVTAIGTYAFYNLVNLESITLPDSLLSIESYAFNNCTSLKAIDIPDSVTKIGEAAFLDCGALKDVSLGDGLEKISTKAFRNCASLDEIYIPQGIKTIEMYTFYGCTSLKNVYMHNSVSTLVYCGFYNCSAIENLYYFGTKEEFSKIVSEEGNGKLTGANIIYSSLDNDFIYSTSNNTVTIHKYLGNNSLLTIPAYISDIPVTSIGDYAIDGNNTVTDIVIEYGITNIGWRSFGACPSLVNVTIPETVQSINFNAFRDSNQLKNVYITDLEDWCNIDFATASSNPLYYAENLILNGEIITDLVIPEGITTIKKFAFFYYSVPKTLTLPSTITTISDSAFTKCNGIETIYFTFADTYWDNISIEANNDVLLTANRVHLHTMSDEWITESEPNCTEAGLKYKQCSVCGEREEKVIDPINHAYTLTESSTVSCTENGYNLFVCDNCGDSYYEDWVDAFGHNYDYDVTDPDCLNKGFTTHTCSNCADTYVDSYVDALGHNYKPVVTDPDCLNKGFTTHTCSNCSDTYVDSYVDALGHNYKPVVTDPDCLNKGFTTHTCSNCSDTYIDSYVDALGHSFSEWYIVDCGSDDLFAPDSLGSQNNYHYFILNKKCSVCDHIEEATASTDEEFNEYGVYPDYNIEITEPHCNDQGYTSYLCPLCNDCCYISDYVDPLGHAYNTTVFDPDCENGGYTTYLCTNCGFTYDDDFVDPLGHTYENNICINCNEEYVLLNTHFDYVIKNGLVTITKYNGNGNILNFPSFLIGCPVVKIEDEAFNNCKTITKIVLPDFLTEIGEYAFWNCTNLVDVTLPDSLQKIGQCAFYGCTSLDVIILPDSITSIEYGTFMYCTNMVGVGFSSSLKYIGDYAFAYCDNITYVMIPEGVTEIGDNAFAVCRRLASVKLPSTISVIRQNAFFGSDSLIFVTYCGSSEDFDSIYIEDGNDELFDTFKIYHNFSDWEIIADATCTEDGYEQRFCDNCGFVETNIIPLKGHTLNESVHYATCTEDGYIHRYCTECDYEEYDTITASGHDIVTESFDPTCTESGYFREYCTKCDYDINTDIVPFGHNFEDWEVIEEPTCNVPGLNKRVCSVCDYEEFDTIEAYGHNYKTSKVDPTCTEQGYIKEYCDKCLEEFSIDYIDSLGHDYSDEWTVDIDPTYNTEGSKSRHCSRCDSCVDNTVIPALIIADLEYTENNGAITITGYKGTVEEIKIPSYINGLPVTSIGAYAFEGNTVIENVTLPYTLVSIGECAFLDCVNLRVLNLGDNVTTLGLASFAGCASLEEIVLPVNVTILPYALFRDCTSLKTIHFTSSNLKIGSAVFNNTSLKVVYFAGSIEEFENLFANFKNEFANVDVRYTEDELNVYDFDSNDVINSLDLATLTKKILNGDFAVGVRDLVVVKNYIADNTEIDEPIVPDAPENTEMFGTYISVAEGEFTPSIEELSENTITIFKILYVSNDPSECGFTFVQYVEADAYFELFGKDMFESIEEMLATEDPGSIFYYNEEPYIGLCGSGDEFYTLDVTDNTISFTTGFFNESIITLTFDSDNEYFTCEHNYLGSFIDGKIFTK